MFPHTFAETIRPFWRGHRSTNRMQNVTMLLALGPTPLSCVQPCLRRLIFVSSREKLFIYIHCVGSVEGSSSAVRQMLMVITVEELDAWHVIHEIPQSLQHSTYRNMK